MKKKNRAARVSVRAAVMAIGAFLLAVATLVPLDSAALQEEAAGIPVEHAATVSNCVRCHAMDDAGRMSRISYERKTPEGWEITIRRMVMLNDVALDPEVARDIVRYLSDAHGLAPEEARPGFFEAERRMIDFDYDDDDTEALCAQCHSMGRVITQRRSEEEWGLLVAMHRGYYPFVDFQGDPGFRRTGPPSPDAEAPSDPGHPMDKAIAHLAETYPLESAEWTAWSANRRPPRLTGRWALAGTSAFSGPVYGFVDVTPVAGVDGQFTTQTTVISAVSPIATTTRAGSANVYAGFQWRGRSADSGAAGVAQREVMFIERDWRSMSGRWFTGAYDEIGVDITLYRGDGPVVAGVYPVALRAGSETQELTIYGVNLPTDVQPSDIDFGSRVMVTEIIDAGAETIRVRASVATDAAIGKRDLFVAGASRPEALVIFDSVDAVRVTPEAGMARLGGVVAPKQFAQFEAIGVSYGVDGEAGTDDDLDIGPVDATWSLEEYAATFDDDDIEFVGELGATGLFTPALDGPNPERSGNRNNVGDVWVVATYEADGLSRPLRGRAHLVVTVPLYFNVSGWEAGGGTTLPASGVPRGGRR